VFGPGPASSVLGVADEPVCPDCNAADYDELDAVVVERTKVELGQGAVALPLMALSCLQSAWTRARRSFMGVRRSASRRISRARLRSPMAPLSALATMQASLAAPLGIPTEG